VRKLRATQPERVWRAWNVNKEDAAEGSVATLQECFDKVKGQACWSATSVKVGLLHRFILDLFAATS